MGVGDDAETHQGWAGPSTAVAARALTSSIRVLNAPRTSSPWKRAVAVPVDGGLTQQSGLPALAHLLAIQLRSGRTARSGRPVVCRVESGTLRVPEVWNLSEGRQCARGRRCAGCTPAFSAASFEDPLYTRVELSKGCPPSRARASAIPKTSYQRMATAVVGDRPGIVPATGGSGDAISSSPASGSAASARHDGGDIEVVPAGLNRLRERPPRFRGSHRERDSRRPPGSRRCSSAAPESLRWARKPPARRRTGRGTARPPVWPPARPLKRRR